MIPSGTFSRALTNSVRSLTCTSGYWVINQVAQLSEVAVAGEGAEEANLNYTIFSGRLHGSWWYSLSVPAAIKVEICQWFNHERVKIASSWAPQAVQPFKIEIVEALTWDIISSSSSFSWAEVLELPRINRLSKSLSFPSTSEITSAWRA